MDCCGRRCGEARERENEKERERESAVRVKKERESKRRRRRRVGGRNKMERMSDVEPGADLRGAL